jgi:hypothetical protein
MFRLGIYGKHCSCAMCETKDNNIDKQINALIDSLEKGEQQREYNKRIAENTAKLRREIDCYSEEA